MAMASASSKRMAELKLNLVFEAVARAWEAGNISERQAKNATKLIAVVRAIWEDPIRTTLIQDDAGRFIGEADPLPDGTWRARRYGANFSNTGVIVPILNNAERHI